MIALRNLRRNRVRSLITVLGAAVGITVFVALSSISLRVKAGLRAAVSSYEGDVVVQSLRSATPPGSRIPEAKLASLGTLDGVQSVAPVVVGSVKTPWNPFFLVFGVEAPFTGRLSLVRGRSFHDDAGELLLGEAARRAIGADVGDEVELAGLRFTVVGTYATGAPLLDGGAIGHLGVIQTALDQEGIVNLALLRVGEGASAIRVIEEVHRTQPRLRATLGSDLIAQTQLFRTVDMFAGAVSLVALLASCLVVTNTLLMAVWERTREIGILMAVGWSRALIVRTLLVESLVLCLFAGVLGNALAVIFLRTLARTGAAGLGWVPVTVPAAVSWTSLGICGLMGLASGLYPAVVSSALSPAQALRHE